MVITDIRFQIVVLARAWFRARLLLPEGRFARIAAIVSPFGLQLTLIARGNGFNSINSYQFSAKTMQFDPDSGSFIVSVVDKLRNHTLQFNSVSYYHFYPTTGAPLRDMPRSNVTDATVLFPLQMLPFASSQLRPSGHSTGEQAPSVDARAIQPSGSPSLLPRGSSVQSHGVSPSGAGGTQAVERTKGQSPPVP